MLKALTMPGATEVVEHEIPYIAAETGGLNTPNACAAMMITATLGKDWAADPEKLAAFSMVANHDERPTLYGQTLTSLSSHGVGITVISDLPLPEFANQGWQVLPQGMSNEFGQLPAETVHAEQCNIGSLLAKLTQRNAYERRAATLDDLTHARGIGWTTMILVNGQTLSGEKTAFRQHSLIVLEAGTEKMIVHDPGNPGMSGQASKVYETEQVLQAWHDTGNTLMAAGFARQVGSA